MLYYYMVHGNYNINLSCFRLEVYATLTFSHKDTLNCI